MAEGEAALEDIPRAEGKEIEEERDTNTEKSAADTAAVGDQVNSTPSVRVADDGGFEHKDIEGMRESPTDQLEGLLNEHAALVDNAERGKDHIGIEEQEPSRQNSYSQLNGEKRANGTNGETEIDGDHGSSVLDIERSDGNGDARNGQIRRKPNGTDGSITEIHQIGPTPGNARPVASPKGRNKSREEMILASPHAAARYGNVAGLKSLISKGGPNEKDSVGFTPVHFAACYGQTESLICLIGAGGDIEMTSEHGWTPLHVAARNGHVECVRILLEAGVNVNKPDNKNWTALHNASCSQSAECVGQLLKYGAEKDKQDDDGWTPLHFAARFNNVDALQKLLEEKADPNVRDVDGWTAMHNSARNGRARCVQVLLEHKADPFQVTRYKETPLHVACRKGKAKVVEKMVLGAEQLGVLPKLLAMQDLDGKKAEHVASSPFIRKSLNKEFAPGGSTYELPGERALRKGHSMREPADEGTAGRKSASCTIL